MDKTEINLSGIKNVLMFLLFTIMFLAIVCLIAFFRDGGKMYFYVVTGFIYYSIAKYFYPRITMIIKKKPSIVIDDAGIIDNSIDPPLFIAWEDVIETRAAMPAKTTDYISISVKNPEKYIDRLQNRCSRAIARIGLKFGKYKVMLDTNLMEYNSYRINDILQIYFDRWKNMHSYSIDDRGTD
ncbi:hypothetical protein FACS189487_09900 [Campylobacterota bacterium]|nr:hypothetical protein FACS189487_09900 [Campylobacterota bacterium]